MPETHDIGKTYIQFFTYPRLSSLYMNKDWRRVNGLSKPRIPLVDTGETVEIEEPYRFGRGVLFRIPFTRRALMIGRWLFKYEDEQTALTAATQAYSMGYSDDWGPDVFGKEGDDAVLEAWLAKKAEEGDAADGEAASTGSTDA